MDLRERREISNGFGDGLARAFEMAVTPAVFGVLGFLVDRQLGIVPWCTIALTVLALAGSTYMTWFRYDAEMKAHEQQAAERRATRGARPPLRRAS